MLRLAHLVTHPIQYFAPLYRALAEEPGVELTVLFGSRHGCEPSLDQDFGRAIRFDVPLLDGYSHEFLPNAGSGAPSGAFGNFDCPDLPSRLTGGRFDALWVHGWGYRFHWQAIRAARKATLPFLIRADTSLVVKPKYSPRWFASRLLLGRMLRSAGACLYVGSSNRAFYASMGVPDSRLFPALFSIDVRAFIALAGPTESRRLVREAVGTPPDAFVVVCSAKAIPRKRLGDAIRALRHLGPSAHLWVLGDGPPTPAT